VEKRIEVSSLGSEIKPLLDDIAATRVECVLVRDGKPVGALVSHQDLLLLRSLREELRERFDRFREKVDEAARSG
jgi:hypothetical protein